MMNDDLNFLSQALLQAVVQKNVDQVKSLCKHPCIHQFINLETFPYRGTALMAACTGQVEPLTSICTIKTTTSLSNVEDTSHEVLHMTPLREKMHKKQGIIKNSIQGKRSEKSIRQVIPNIDVTHENIESNYIQIISELAHAGADCNAKKTSSKLMTALHLAVLYGREQIVYHLLLSFSNPDSKHCIDLTQLDDDRDTIFSYVDENTKITKNKLTQIIQSVNNVNEENFNKRLQGFYEGFYVRRFMSSKLFNFNILLVIISFLKIPAQLPTTFIEASKRIVQRSK